MRRSSFVLACAVAALTALAALAAPALSVAGPAGVRHPLAPPQPGHAIWDPDRHFFWVFESTAEGVWSWNPTAVTHWQWHGVGSFGTGAGNYAAGHRVFLDRTRNRLVAPFADRLETLPIRARMTWEQVPVSGVIPIVGETVHDAAGDRLVSAGADGALWQLTLADPPAWSALPVTNALPGLAGDQALGLDPEHGVLVIAGGTRFDAACNAYVPSYQVWKLALATMTWTALPDLNVPGAYDLQLFWDEPRHRMLAAGGRYGFFCEASGQWYEASSAQVFALDPVAASPAWALVTTRPGARTSGAVARNEDSDQLVTFGGFAPANGAIPARTFNDVQSMPLAGPSANVWTQDSPNSPDAAIGPDFAFDATRGHVLMHGGLRPLSAYGDYATSGAVLAFDDPDTLWSGFTTAHDAMDAAVVTLPALDRVVWFGGRAKSPIPASVPVWLNATTTVSLATGVATQPVTGVSPAARSGAVMAYDAARSRVLLVGGRDAALALRTDVWALSPLAWTWTPLTTTGTPPAGDVKSACNDATTDRTFVLANDGTGATLHALLPAGAAVQWADVASAGAMPALQSLALDPARHRLLGVSAELAVYEAAIGSGTGPLTWVELQPALTTGVDVVAMFDVTDDRLLLGLRSMPSAPEKAGLWAVEFGAGALDVPHASRAGGLALRLVGRQPAPHGPEVECTLDEAAPASRLELFDVVGRRVWVRELGALGAGRHVLHAGEGTVLAPGLYVVRLAAGGRQASARAIVVR